MTHRHRRFSSVTAGSLFLTLSLAACGGGDGNEGSADPIQIGYFPLVHTATAVEAKEAGLFDDADLDVELVATAGGAQAIPGLMAGDYDVTYANYTSAILGAQQGLPIVFVAGNDVGSTDHGIFVKADSPIEEVADLEGATFAVNNLQNIGTVAIKSQLADAGIDPEAVSLVELPYPDMQAALDRGDVDAIWQVEPFQASAVAAGLRKVADLFSGSVEGMPVAGWITTREFATENAEAVEGIREALADAAADLDGNRDRLVELVPTFTEVPAEVVESVELPVWEAELDEEALQETADLMLEYGIIDAAFEVETMMP